MWWNLLNGPLYRGDAQRSRQRLGFMLGSLDIPMGASDIFTKNCDWLYFAQRTGRAGQEWAENYRCHLPKLEVGKRALELMRRGQIERGGELLQEFIGLVGTACNEPSSIKAVLGRYTHGIQGYYFYCRGEFASAKEAMWLAHENVARALSTADWLRLLAVHCQEFRLHMARISRNQNRLPEMQAYIGEARAMMSDGLPLCETEDGRKILWSGFKPFFDTLQPLTPEETREANTLLDPNEREYLFNQFVRNMLSSRARIKYA